MGTSPTVERSAAVLVVIDVQERLAAAMARRSDVVQTTVLLAEVARELGIPVIVTRQYPQGLGDVVPELAAVAAEATVVDKVTFRCTDEPAFSRALAETGKRQVVIAGMEAHICV